MDYSPNYNISPELNFVVESQSLEGVSGTDKFGKSSAEPCSMAHMGRIGYEVL